MKRRDNYRDEGSRKRTRRSGGDGSNASVFVGQLSTRTSWQDLKDHMRRAGNVDRANILKNTTGGSKNCALVDYEHPREAERAIRELNDSMLDGQRILVRVNEHSQGSHHANRPHSAPAKSTTMYVGNLDYSVTWQTLKDKFKPFGRVEHAEIAEEGGGRSRGWGLVRFADARDAAAACRRMDAEDWMGRRLEVRPDKKETDKAPRHSDHRDADSNQIYVGNLSYDTSWQNLKDFVRETCGTGDTVHVEVIEGSDGRSKGYGIVKFSSAREASRAIRQLDEKELQGRQLHVRADRGVGGDKTSARVASGRSGDEGCQLFVKNLSFDTKWQDLKDHFRQCGQVEHTEVMERPDGSSKGVGLVKFANANDAARAIKDLNDIKLQGRALEIRLDEKPGSRKPRGDHKSTAMSDDEESESYNHEDAMDTGLKAPR